MRNNKQKNDKPSPEELIEQKVDAMMDTEQPDVPKTPAQTTASELPPIDIFSETVTAPPLPGAKVPKEPAQAKVSIPAEITPEDAPTENTPQGPVEEVANQPFEDPETDKAVESIVRDDADKLLAAEDAVKTPSAPVKSPGLTTKIKHFFAAWWNNKKARYATFAVIGILIIGAGVWPTSRYFVLNTVGIRSGASMTVLDESTGLPLKNAIVKLGSLQTKTNSDGKAIFKQIKLGSQKLVIDRVAFAPIEKNITVGWGSNPLGTYSLSAVGAQYIFNVTDYLSGKGVVKVEATSGESSAFADKKGTVVLTVENPDTETLTVNIKADGYRTEKLTFPAATQEKFDVRMVPAQPLVYVTKQSGKYDLYKVDVDGKNKKLLLAGTGSERQSIGLVVSPDGVTVALISSRTKQRDAGGYLLNTLTLVDVKTGQAKEIDQAQTIQPVDWIGKRLIYKVTYAAPSAANTQRQRIISYNTEENARAVLATSDYFNSVTNANGYIYYAIASSDPSQSAAFIRIKADGGSKQTLLNKQTWSVVRIDARNMSLETPDGWYDYAIGDSAAKKGNPPADTYASRQYIENASNHKSLWIDNRDGKGVLLAYDQKANKDNVIVTASGLTLPVRWLSNNTVAYRIINNSETADYVKNIDGGEARKITDVTATYGFDTTR